MEHHLSISIPTPCHEKWTDFKPTNKGGYCAGCQKEVVDFTNWSDAQIIDFFSSTRSTPSCGRFRTDQIKTYRSPSAPASSKFLPISFFSAALALVPTPASAIDCPTPEIEITPLINQYEPPQDSTGRKVVTGKIVAAEDGSPMPGVNIVLKGTESGTVSDENGEFTFVINNPDINDALIFTFIGYKTVERKIFEVNSTTIALNADITVLGEPSIMGGISIRRCSPRATWWRIKNVFK